MTPNSFFLPLLAAAALLRPIPLRQAAFDASGSFVDCTLEDGRELRSTAYLVSVDHRALAKSIPRAFTDGKFQYLRYEGWQFVARVKKQTRGPGHERGVQIRYLDSSVKPAGTVDMLRCR